MNFKKKKLLIICHSYNHFQKLQIELLAPFFDKITVLVRYKPVSELYKIFNVPALKAHAKINSFNLENVPKNIKVIAVNMFYLPIEKSYKNLGKKHYKKVFKIIKEKNIKFDIIIAHFLWSSGYVANLLALQFKKPAFVIIHENHKRYERHISYENKSFWKGILGVFSVNKKNIKKISKTFNVVEYLPNIFDENIFYKKDQLQCREFLKLDLKKTIILNVANYTIQDKNQLNLLEAFSLFLIDYPDSLLILIGNDMGDGNRIESHIRSLKLEDHVLLKGFVKNIEIPNWINACDIFTLPSNNESFGIVQIEALACGKPIVATMNGGSEEIINKKVGVISNSKEKHGIYSAMVLAKEKKWNTNLIIEHSNIFNKKTYIQTFLNSIEKLITS